MAHDFSRILAPPAHLAAVILFGKMRTKQVADDELLVSLATATPVDV
jgi:hypothetical protein